MIKTGDIKETQFLLNNEQYLLTAEFLGLETVSTPAGTFDDCLKFRIQNRLLKEIHPKNEYELLWLAKDVGFVKAQNFGSDQFALFSKNNTTRLLNSYHITSNDIDNEELRVRNAYRDWIRNWNENNLTAMALMTHDDYFEECKDKTAAMAHWRKFLSDHPDYSIFTSIEGVTIDGESAYILAEFLATYDDGTKEGTTRRWGRSTLRFKNHLGQWKVYGSQQHIYPSWISVYPRRTPKKTTFATPIEITDCADNKWADTADQISSIKLTGPPGSGIVDFELIDTWDPDEYWSGFWKEFDKSMAKNGFYTIHVTDVNNNQHIVTDYLSASDEFNMPALKAPANAMGDVNSEVKFEWGTVLGANSYKLEVFEINEQTGKTGAKVVSHTTNKNAHKEKLEPGKKYSWRVRARYYDPNDNDKYDNESRSPKQSFSTIELAAVASDNAIAQKSQHGNIMGSLGNEVATLLQAWAHAWERTAGKNANLKSFMGYYSDDFSYNGLSKAQWIKDKAAKGKRKKWIEVNVKIKRMNFLGGREEIQVDLEQKYRSSNYSDKSIKMLRLIKYGSGWKIISETTL